MLAVERGVIVGGKTPHRQEELGHQYERHESRKEHHIAIDQPESQHNRHTGQGKGGKEVEHGRGERRRAQRTHGRPAQALGNPIDGICMAAGPPKGAQHVQAAHGVEKMVAEPRLLELTLLGKLTGIATDHHHVEHDEGKGDERDDARHPVQREHGNDDHQGDHCKVDALAE